MAFHQQSQAVRVTALTAGGCVKPLHEGLEIFCRMRDSFNVVLG